MAQLNRVDHSGWCAGNSPPPRLMTISQKTIEQAPVDPHLDPGDSPHSEATGCGHHPLSIWRWFAAVSSAGASAPPPRPSHVREAPCGVAVARGRPPKPTPSSRARQRRRRRRGRGARRGSPSSSCTFARRVAGVDALAVRRARFSRRLACHAGAGRGIAVGAAHAGGRGARGRRWRPASAPRRTCRRRAGRRQSAPSQFPVVHSKGCVQAPPSATFGMMNAMQADMLPPMPCLNSSQVIALSESMQVPLAFGS